MIPQNIQKNTRNNTVGFLGFKTSISIQYWTKYLKTFQGRHKPQTLLKGKIPKLASIAVASIS